MATTQMQPSEGTSEPVEKVYLGTKIIKAVPMNLATFNRTVRCQEAAEQDRDVLGYKVTYPPFVLGDDAYVSWSPKNVFENAYREITSPEKAILV